MLLLIALAIHANSLAQTERLAAHMALAFARGNLDLRHRRGLADHVIPLHAEALRAAGIRQHAINRG